MNSIINHIIENQFDTPTLVLSINQVVENYQKFVEGMPAAHVHYAVKANPEPKLLRKLNELGSKFDAASIREIELCLEAGAPPEHISFGNTVKYTSHITQAFNLGIRLFAADAEEELAKIAEYAPGSRVFIRILVENSQAEWPLSRKFGCRSDMALQLLHRAKDLGLTPEGLSFHVGSQTRHPEMWFDCLEMVSKIWAIARYQGIELSLLNIGGGFPSYYGTPITDPVEYGRVLTEKISSLFPGLQYLMAEPGRGMVANIGMIACRTLLVSKKSASDEHRWVYLNIGRFNGLAETESEAIKYQLIVPAKMNSEMTKCIVAGPTCDSADVLYETNKVDMPVDLCNNDLVIIKNTGAYTTTYSTIAFNGFEPLKVVVLD
jgi:ornithine decarboxylase